MDLTQRKLFTSKQFAFKESGLQIKFKNLTSSQELEIPYEEIDVRKTMKNRSSDNIFLILTCIFSIAFIFNLAAKISGSDDISWGALVVLFIVTSFSILLSYNSNKRQILIPTINYGSIDLFEGRPSKQMTEKFISDLQNRSNEFLKNKYGKIDRYLPIEPQLSSLMFLKDRDILSAEEFDTLKNQLLGIDKSKNPIGFRY